MPRRPLASLLALACFLVLSARGVCADPLRISPKEPRLERRGGLSWHGPIELRETWLLAQPRLTLPPASADLLAPGRTRARFTLHRGNDFGWSQNEEGEEPAVRRFLVDGEHQTTAFEVRRGIACGLDVGVRVPVLWRGAGFLDGIIDVFHESTGTMDNIRNAFNTDRYRVEGRDRDGQLFSWNDERGVGLGQIEVDVRTSLGCFAGGSWALALRASLPTGTGPFRHRDGVDLGAQVLHTRFLAPRWRLHAGVGVVRHGDLDLDGLRYERWRPSGFVVIELRWTERITAILQTSWAGSLITNVEDYPDVHGYLDAGLVFRLNRCMALEVLMHENLADQQSTTDVSLLVSLVHDF